MLRGFATGIPLMLAVFRRNLNSWVARLFFIMLIGTFVLWGVGDVVRNFASDSGVATVAGRKIEVPEVQDAYRRQLAQVTRMFGGRIEPTPQMRKGIAAQALEGIITQAALGDAVARLGLVVPDDAVRQATFDTPSFRGASGQFSRDQFVAVLRNNGFTEARYLDLMRADLGQRQLMDAVRAGMASPEVLTRAVYAFQRETRIADAVDLAFSAPPRIEPPTDALLTRWYENNKARYSTPELRHIHAVILAPATVASEIQISEDEIKAVYEQRRAGYNLPEKRSVQVLLTQDEAKAKELAAKWLLGGEFAALATDGAVPVELTDAIKAEIPAPELADAVFAAAADVVPAPVHSALGWHVFKVTKIEPGTQKTLADVSAELRARILADKAADLIYERASKIEDLLAGGTKLQELPADFGLAAVAGTMDAQGNTAAGEPAPIPGPPALRAALAQAVFAAAKGEPAKLNEVPRDAEGNQAYFAVDVDDITDRKSVV